jgi:ribonuclease M5
MKPHIQQVIVVEGHHDTAALKRVFDCDTIETGGSALDEETLRWIEAVQKKRGVIVFTDPDSPGNRIRSAINQRIPGCLNAFVDKRDACTEKKVGVEHASPAALQDALAHLVTIVPAPPETITMSDMMELGLAGGKGSSARRAVVGGKYHLGNGTARTMCRRLNCLGVTREKLAEDLKEWLKK